MGYTVNASTSTIEEVSRSGGYGHLLGDEGSAFSIGRDCLRHLLAGAHSESPAPHSGSRLRPMVEQYFSVGSEPLALLPAVYAGSDPTARVHRIAGLARIVQACAFPNEARWPASSPAALGSEPDALALLILQTAAKHCSELAQQSLLAGGLKERENALALGGSVWLSDGFRQLFMASMDKRGISFEHVELVRDALPAAARFLSKAGIP